MKGIGSHGSCKNYYKDFVIASADMPDVDTTDTYVQHMAVCNCISYLVWNYLHHSYIGVWIRTGNRHRGNQNACDRLYIVYSAYSRWLGCSVAGSNQNSIDGRLKDGINRKNDRVHE